MLGLILALFLSPINDTKNLSSNNYEIREEATKNLRDKEILSFPALFYTLTYSTDLEQRARASRALTYLTKPYYEAYKITLAIYLIFGPDEMEDNIQIIGGDGTHRRYLGKNERFVKYLPLDYLVSIDNIAEKCGLYEEINFMNSGRTPYRLSSIDIKSDYFQEEIRGWINFLRYSAYTLKINKE